MVKNSFEEMGDLDAKGIDDDTLSPVDVFGEPLRRLNEPIQFPKLKGKAAGVKKITTRTTTTTKAGVRRNSQ